MLGGYDGVSFICLLVTGTSPGLLSLQKTPDQTNILLRYDSQVIFITHVIIQQFFFDKIDKLEYIYTYDVEQGRR